MKIARYGILALASATGILFAIPALTGSESSMTVAAETPSVAHAASAAHSPERHKVHKVLLIGDSMTGWMGERLEAYGRQNGFEVATVVWDGSTIPKWGKNAARLKQIIQQQKPDAVFVSLGLNELLEKNPATRFGTSFDQIRSAVGDLPMVWVGPPSWPGKPGGEALNKWLASQMGDGGFFRSSDLKLARQSASNPHPSRDGITKWVDAFVEWIPGHTNLEFPGLDKPKGPQMVRGKTYIYRKMKESL